MLGVVAGGSLLCSELPKSPLLSLRSTYYGMMGGLQGVGPDSVLVGGFLQCLVDLVAWCSSVLLVQELG